MMYRTICAEEVDVLDRKVNKALAEGWIIHGSVFADGCKKCQTMVTNEPVDESTTDTDKLLLG